MKSVVLPLLATAAALSSLIGNIGCSGGATVDVGVKTPVGPVPVSVGINATPVPPPPPPPSGPPRKISLTGLPLDGAQLAGIPDIEFDTGTANLKRSPQNDMVLNLLLRAGQTYTTITRLRVEGHTDSRGNEVDNQRLSEARAIAVVDWLTAHGIARVRLNPVGCASRDPLFPNDTDEHLARNRRVEFDIETIEDAPVEGGTAPCAPNTFRHVR
jgi:outer membrane protein OmpA-like peptidoglycan-associated protein